MMEARLIFFNDARLLEGPCWDAAHGALYFVAIRQNTVFRLEVGNGRVTSYATQGCVGAAVLRGEELLVAEKSGIYRLDPATGARRFLAQPEPDPAMRYNDGKLDPRGRFLIGTMGDPERNTRGGLYAVEPDGSSRRLIGGTTIANGLGFSLDERTLYFIDTPTRKVMAYGYDVETGTLSTPGRVAVAIEGEGSPDGMCVDAQGRLWVALFGGGRVCRFDPETGRMDAEIALPCRNVTSCCIGGEAMDTLFITTAKCAGLDEPLAGGLFAAKLTE